MNFSDALGEVKRSEKIRRAGWNGKGMFVFYQKGYTAGVASTLAEDLGVAVGTPVVFEPYLAMKTVSGSIVPWLASQTDILAEDWEVV